MLSSTSWNPIGPAPIVGNTSDGGTVTGRVTAIAADPNPSDTAGNTVYIGTGGGGIWMGQNVHSSTPTWTALTDDLATQTGDPLINLNVGAIATAWDSNTSSTIIYAGLGEANVESNLMTTTAAASQFYGAGILKGVSQSVNGKTTWTWTVLGGQGSSNLFYRSAISKIIIDPTNPENLYAAVSTAKNGVVGNEGIWNSSNGGASWVNKTASQIPGSNVDMFSDLIMDPSNDQVLYAAVGEATGGAANGVYMTTNGGTTWTQMTNLPSGAGVGRISLALSGNLSASGSPEYELYAAFMMDRLTQTATVTGYSQNGNIVTLDYSGFTGLQNFQTNETVTITGVGSGLNGGQEITGATYDSTTGTGTIQFSVNSSATISQTSASGTINSEIGGLYQLGYVTIGGVSGDTTAAWNVIPGFNLPTPNGFDDSSPYNYVGNQGYYGTALTVNSNTTTQGSVQLYAAGEESFLQINDADSSNPTVNDLEVEKDYGPSIHVDHHAILIDPANSGSNSYTVLDGSDGGVWAFNPNGSQGSFWTDLNTNLQVGQFYGIAINPTNTKEIYGGVQDNGNVRTLNASPSSTTWQAASNDDGSLIYIDPTTQPYETVYFTVGALVYQSNSNANPFDPNATTNLNASTSSTYFSETNQPDNDVNSGNSAVIGDFPGVTYLMEGVTVNGQYSDCLWYGGGDARGNGSLWLSTNGGQSWSLIGYPTPQDLPHNGWVPTQQVFQNDFAVDSTPVDSIGVNPNSPGTVYVGMRGGYLLTTTNGLATTNGVSDATWKVSHPVSMYQTQVELSSPLTLSPTTTTINVVSTNNFPDAGQLFVQTATGTIVLTYTGKTKNSFTGVSGGNGYTLANNDTVTFQNDLRFSDILVDPINPQTAYVTIANFGDVTGGSHVLMTNDGGSTWIDISGTLPGNSLPDVPVWCIQQAIIGGQQVLFVGTDLGVYSSSDGGKSWSPFGANLPNVQVRSMSLVPDSSNSGSFVLAVGTWGHGAYQILIPATATNPPSPPASPPPATHSKHHSVFADKALNDFNAGSTRALQHHQFRGAPDSYAAYVFANGAQFFASRAYNDDPQLSAVDWYLADYFALYGFQFSYLSYLLSHNPAAADAASYELDGLVNGLFALLNP